MDRLKIIEQLKEKELKKTSINKLLDDAKNIYSDEIEVVTNIHGQIYGRKSDKEKFIASKTTFIRYLNDEINLLETEINNLVKRLSE